MYSIIVSPFCSMLSRILHSRARKVAASILVSVVFLAGCASDSSLNANQKTAGLSKLSPHAVEADVSLLYKQATQVLFKERALSATLYGLSAEDVGKAFSAQLEDYSPANESMMRASLYRLSEKIRSYSSEGSSTSDKETQLVMSSLTRYFSGHPDFSIGYIDTWMGLSPFIVNQINGPLITIPRYLQSEHSINNEADAQDYIERLAKFEKLVASVQEKLSADVAKNWIPPKAIIVRANHYFDTFLKPEPLMHPLVTTFQEKLAQVESISQEKKKRLITSATEKVSQVVYPAFRSIAEQMQELLPQGRDESGIWAQPNGGKYYQDAIRQLGDSDLTADQIHQIGLDEVERISLEMDAILNAEGRKAGSVGERLIALNNDPRFLYPDSVEGRQTLLNDLNGYIEEITEKMSGVFKSKPSYKVEVRAFPIEIQDNAPGGEYTSPAIDGSKPGIYWINLRDIKANPTYSLKSLTYHEANPGHHWQVALNLEQAELPFLRRIAPYNAYIEGWALYSELVAEEIGMYTDDPYGNLGRLQGELFRAVRLVVDTGLHHKRWTREKAITYMVEKTGATKGDVTSEIERYMSWPGQALGYKLGMLKILELRQKAKQSLGERFDLAAFHDLVLLGGAVPMTVLESKVNSWIDSQQ